MQSLDLAGLIRLDDDLQSILDKTPEKRRELHERIAKIVKEEVDTEISQSGLHDSSGRVKQWQEPVVGSGGGYAAVRATDKSTGNNSPGAITNYLENGHRIRQPSGRNPYYSPRIKNAYVDGFHFYSNTKNSIESKVIGEVERFVDGIMQELGG